MEGGYTAVQNRVIDVRFPQQNDTTVQCRSYFVQKFEKYGKIIKITRRESNNRS